MASYADFDRMLEAVKRWNDAMKAQHEAMMQMARETRAAIATIPEQPATPVREWEN